MEWIYVARTTMTHRIVTGTASIMLTALTVSFIVFVEEKVAQYEGPMDEIQVTFKKPMTTMQMLIAKCPNVFGKLDDFLDCREKVVYKYR